MLTLEQNKLRITSKLILTFIVKFYDSIENKLAENKRRVIFNLLKEALEIIRYFEIKISKGTKVKPDRLIMLIFGTVLELKSQLNADILMDPTIKINLENLIKNLKIDTLTQAEQEIHHQFYKNAIAASKRLHTVKMPVAESVKMPELSKPNNIALTASKSKLNPNAPLFEINPAPTITPGFNSNAVLAAQRKVAIVPALFAPIGSTSKQGFIKQPPRGVPIKFIGNTHTNTPSLKNPNVIKPTAIRFTTG
jgi:hypothetical protein